MGKGGGGKSAKIPVSPLETETANQLREYYQGTQKPLQTAVTPQVLAGFGENQLFSKTPDPYAIDVLSQQFGQAKNQLLGEAPIRGGRLARQMTDLAKDRAMGISGLYAQKGAEARGALTNLLPAIFPNAAANQAGMTSLAGQQNQRNALQAQMTAQNQRSMGSGISGLLGSALFGGGYGEGGKNSMASSIIPAIGSALSLFFGSSRAFKEGIQLYDGDALKHIKETPIYTWKYIGDGRSHLGPVTEEAPQIIVSDDGKALVPIDYLGFLFAAIKQLNEKVEALSHAA